MTTRLPAGVPRFASRCEISRRVSNDDGTGHYEARHFAVYVTDSGNSSDTNSGLADYAIFVGGAATISSFSPKGFYDDGTGCGTDDAIGFTFLRSGKGAALRALGPEVRPGPWRIK